MALTRDFRETVMANVRRDPAFRRALLCEALDACLNGELDVGKMVLRNVVNATIGFEGLSQRIGIPSKSLHRMLSQHGNPSTENFFTILGALATETETKLSVAAGPRRSRRRA